MVVFVLIRFKHLIRERSFDPYSCIKMLAFTYFVVVINMCLFLSYHKLNV